MISSLQSPNHGNDKDTNVYLSPLDEQVVSPGMTNQAEIKCSNPVYRRNQH